MNTPNDPNQDNDDLTPTDISDNTAEDENVAYLQTDAEDTSEPESTRDDELQHAKEQMMRALAEAENTRKRAAREREDTRKYAISDFAKDLLSFSDNFHRALEAIPDSAKENEDVASIITGIEAMNASMTATFERHGIKKIEPVDELFNPNFHEVMFEAPSPDKPPGTILQILEPGYMIHDRLLRPARVGVVKDDGQDTGSVGLDTEI